MSKSSRLRRPHIGSSATLIAVERRQQIDRLHEKGRWKRLPLDSWLQRDWVSLNTADSQLFTSSKTICARAYYRTHRAGREQDLDHHTHLTCRLEMRNLERHAHEREASLPRPKSRPQIDSEQNCIHIATADHTSQDSALTTSALDAARGALLLILCVPRELRVLYD